MIGLWKSGDEWTLELYEIIYITFEVRINIQAGFLGISMCFNVFSIKGMVPGF